MSTPVTTWWVTPDATVTPDRMGPTPTGTLNSIVSLLYRIGEQLGRVDQAEGLVLLDREAAHMVGLGDPARALDYAAAQGWRHTQPGPIISFFGNGRPEVHVGQLKLLQDAGPRAWPWGIRLDDDGGAHYRWPGDVVAALNEWHRLSPIHWQAGPQVMGIKLLHKLLGTYRVRDDNGKTHQRTPDKVCDATPEGATEPPWTPAMWSRKPGLRWGHQLDRVRAGLTAARTAKVSPPKLMRGHRQFDRSRAGWWLFSMPAWNDPRMPHPAGPGEVYSRVWRTTDTLALVEDLAKQGMIDMPEVIDSLTGPARQQLDGWAIHLEGMYQADGYDEQLVPIVREVTKAVAVRGLGMLAATDLREDGTRVPNSSIFRPDWYAAVNAIKRANGWRKAWQLGQTCDLWPFAVDDDAWWYDTDEPDPAKAFAGATAHMLTRANGERVPLLDLTRDIPGAYRVKQTRDLRERTPRPRRTAEKVSSR